MRDGEFGHNYILCKGFLLDVTTNNLKNLKTTGADSTVFGNSLIIDVYVCTNVDNLDPFLRELDGNIKLPIKS